MIKAGLISGCVLFITVSLFADDVSLSGTVRKAGTTTGIEGVKVSLAKFPSLSATTDAEGKFSITGTTSVKIRYKQPSLLKLNINGKNITIRTISENSTVKAELFSADGKREFFTELFLHDKNIKPVSLPWTGPGVNVIKITAGAEIFVLPLISMGKELYIMNNSPAAAGPGAVMFQNSASAAAVDTLIASKNGYKTKKTPIGNYTMENIVIEIDTAAESGGKCTRETLQELVNGYIAALEAGDPKKMNLAEGAKYIENMKNSSFEKGIWLTKIKVCFHRDFLDVDSCSAFVELFDSISAHAYNIGAQIRTSEGKIKEISALVADSGDWAIKGRADIAKMVRISSGEKWALIPKAQQNDRATIKAAGDAYLDVFKDKSVQVPWGTPCARLEGSMYTGNANNPGGSTGTCDVGIPDNLSITDRHYIIDVEMGSVDIFCKFGGAMPDSHLFRVENGKLRYVHTISIQN